MMNQGVIFSGDGPLMKGNWFNPETGDSFTVRDSFFENNQYIVTTTDGRTLSYNQLQHYVQSDKPMKPQKLVQSKPVQEELPSDIQALIEEPSETAEEPAGMLPEDAALLGNLYEPRVRKVELPAQQLDPIQIVQQTPEPVYPVYEPVHEDKNTYIIEKALSRATQPSVNFDISWDEFPKREIDMLVDLMDISKDEIIKWYVSKIDKEEIYNKIFVSLKEYITNTVAPEIKKETKITKTVKPVRQIKKVRKTTTK